MQGQCLLRRRARIFAESVFPNKPRRSARTRRSSPVLSASFSSGRIGTYQPFITSQKAIGRQALPVSTRHSLRTYGRRAIAILQFVEEFKRLREFFGRCTHLS